MKQTRLLQLLAVVGILGCSSSGKVVGTIYVIGNEPFTQVAVEDSAGTLYRIETTKELERQLRSMQGRKVELRYSKLTTTEIGKTIAVESIHEIDHP
jgi:uncharacterized membrane protein